jgi:hypothetical protein
MILQEDMSNENVETDNSSNTEECPFIRNIKRYVVRVVSLIYPFSGLIQSTKLIFFLDLVKLFID